MIDETFEYHHHTIKNMAPSLSTRPTYRQLRIQYYFMLVVVLFIYVYSYLRAWNMETNAFTDAFADD